MYCSKIYPSLYPVNAPKTEGKGNTINLPKSVTYFGLLTIVPMKL